jgi:hypothetical protein
VDLSGGGEGREFKARGSKLRSERRFSAEFADGAEGESRFEI